MTERIIVWRCYICGEVGYGQPEVKCEEWTPRPDSLGRTVPAHRRCVIYEARVVNEK